MKCNVRSTSPDRFGQLGLIKCDEECARLQRNRDLAVALDISDSHTDDHVPYSTVTLKMYLEDTKWCHTQEEVLRIFAADEDEKRLRFKPMKARQRAFIHSIAVDFGFDGESMDPEPHRHVILFKTPKFVAAPMKTLAQGARIRRAALNVAAPVNSVSESRTEEKKHDYNGLLLTKARFGLIEDELRRHISKAATTTELGIFFLPSTNEIALLPSKSRGISEQLTTLVTSLQPRIAAEVIRHGLATEVKLCLFDTSGLEVKVLRQQGVNEALASDGWSQVAAQSAAPAQAPLSKAVGQRPIYTVLGSKLAEAKRNKAVAEELERKRKEEAETIAEDWEEEAEKEDTHGEHDLGNGYEEVQSN